MKTTQDIVKRCTCLEVLLQRVALEVDDDLSVSEREELRAKWLPRLAELGLADELVVAERAVLDEPVGALSDANLIYADSSAACIPLLLWCVRRVAELPTVPDLIDDEVAMEWVDTAGVLPLVAAEGVHDAVSQSSARDLHELEQAAGAFGEALVIAAEGDDDDALHAALVAQQCLVALRWALDDDAAWDDDTGAIAR